MKILSIDWDYFIEATAKQRCTLFPDGGSENIPSYIQKYVWSSHYINPELENITVKKQELDLLKEILSQNVQSVMITDSHKHIYDFIIDNLDYDECNDIDITNIDFHHDLYGINDKSRDLDCGNWAVKLIQEYNCSYSWVNQNDSDKHLDDNDFININEITLNDIKNDDFDYIYICKSSMWSPPHLDKYFNEMFENFLHKSEIEVIYEPNVFNDRFDESLQDIIRQEKNMIKSIHNDNILQK